MCEDNDFIPLENIKFVLKYNFRVSNHFFQKKNIFVTSSLACVEIKKNSQENNIKAESSKKYTRNEQKNNIEIITFSLRTIRNNFQEK